MRPSIGLSLLFVLTAAACSPTTKDEASDPKAESKVASKPCDQNALAALAQSLTASPATEEVKLVAEGLLSACEGALAPTTEHYLRDALAPQDPRVALAEDAQFTAARLRICPDADNIDKRFLAGGISAQERSSFIFETCKFDRYGLTTAEEAAQAGGPNWITWTTLDKLLEDGTPPEVAKTIARALISLEQVLFASILIELLEDQQLPKVTVADSIPDGDPLYVSMDELQYLQQSLVKLKEGKLAEGDVKHHLISSLFEVLQEEVEKNRMMAEHRDEEWEGRLILALDHRLPFSTLVDVMYTSGRAEFSTYSIVVEPGYPVRRAIHINPPKFELGAPQAARVKVFILREGYRVIQPGQEALMIDKLDPEGNEAAAWDLAGLVEAAKPTDPDMVTAVVSGENTITVGVLMATYAALLGPQCKQAEAKDCVFSNLLIEAGAG